jgi:raffinose/stachyose/melibiose transport system permease protein
MNISEHFSARLLSRMDRVDARRGARPAGPGAGSRGNGRRPVLASLVLVITVTGALIVASPFLLVITNSFKTEAVYDRTGPLSWPSSISFSSWAAYIQDADYWRLLFNSVVISGLIAILAVTVSVLAAFAIGIGRVKGRRLYVGLLLIGTMIPQEALIYPLFYEAAKLHLTDTIWAVILIFVPIYGAFGTYLVASTLGTFPRSVLDAAEIDGAGRRQILWRVVVPMIRPTLTVLLVFFFIWSWNEYLIPLVMLTDPSVQTIPIALAALKGQNIMNVTEMNAGALLSLLPTLIFFLLFQRTLMRGIAAGAVK